MRSRVFKGFSSSLLAVAFLSVSLSAFAATPEEDARAAMRRGLAAFGRHDTETALAEYRRAIELVPDANLPHRYAAEALDELTHYEDAIVEYEKYLEIKPDVSDAGEVRERIASARRKIHGTIAITSSPAGADVFLDDAPAKVGTTPIASLEVTRGPHRLVVRYPDRKDVVLTPNVKGGETVSLACDFGESAKAVVVAPRHAEEPQTKSSRSPVGWLLLGGGAAILAGSFATDVFALSPAYDDFNRMRRAGDPGALDKKNQVDALQTTLLVTYGVGAVAAVSGAVMLLLPRSSHEAARQGSTSVTPFAGPGALGASLTGSFGAL